MAGQRGSRGKQAWQPILCLLPALTMALLAGACEPDTGDVTPTRAPSLPTPTPGGPTEVPATGTPVPATPTLLGYPTPTPHLAGPTGTPGGSSPAETPGVTPGTTATPPTPVVEPTPGDEPARYRAVVRTTENGVIHVVAADLGSVAFGQAYFFARHYLCTLADQVVRVRSERARYFGEGSDGKYLDSDFGYLALNVYAHAEQAVPEQTPEVRALLEGFAAGYNRYLADTPPGDWPADCAGAEWVRPVTATDLLAYYMSMTLLASGDALIPGIARAQPPGAPPVGDPPSMRSMALSHIGSNGWALGRDRTTTGRGMLVANPHFPWEGQLKFFENHLTVPGVIDVYGASLIGSPLVNIGFNARVAWTHTFSWASRGTLYRLKLNPADPTAYRYGNGYRKMTATTFQVEVRQPDGSLETVSRTLYRTHYGPMVSTEELGWTGVSALTFRDANENNTAMIAQFLAMNTAQDLEAFARSLETIHGLPWAHTMAVDAEGNTYYVDASAVPNLSEATLDAWQAALEDDPLTQFAWELGMPLLDGSDPANEWVDDPRAGRPGLIPVADAPQLRRTDFVFNSNDNHWLTNPAEPLEGFSPLYGPERTPRSSRTRMNLTLLTETGDHAASGTDFRFSLEELLDMYYTNRAMLADLLRADVAERCQGTTVVPYDGERVNIAFICDTISDWNGRADLDAVGEVAWREFIGTFEPADRVDAGPLFAVPFDPDDPIATPNTLAPPPEDGPDPVLQALAAAVSRLETAGLAPDTTLRSCQYTLKGSERIPLHGAQDFEGGFQVVYYSNSINATLLPAMSRGEVIYADTDLTDQGYLVNYGTSFMLVLSFDDTGPRGKALLSYSQSNDPASPYFADQTPLFAEKQWRDVRFTEEEIAASPVLDVVELTGPE